MNCTELSENLTLYLYDELSAEQREGVEAHLAECAACRDQVEQYRRLHQVLTARPSPEPSPDLVVQCRTALEEALDHELAGVSWASLFKQWSSGFGSLGRLPIAAALTLAVVGFTLGWTLRPRASAGRQEEVNKASILSPTETDLSNLRINNISQVTPDPNKSGDVRITVNAERQMTLEGSLDNPRSRQVLIDAMTGYDNPGIRHDSMEVLSRHADKPNVRSALLYAIQNDPNAGVRLDALQVVQGMEWSPEVQQTLVNTLDHEKNQGIRVAAIDVFADHADRAALPALERWAADDSNRYVRMKAVSAVRKLQGE